MNTSRTTVQASITVSWMEMIRRIVQSEAAKLGVEINSVPRRVLLSSVSAARAYVRSR